jgi:hypothetical protein
MQRIYDIIRGPTILSGQAPGLGTFLKNELGSYITAAISYDEYPEYIRKALDNPEVLIAAAERSRRESRLGEK